MADLLNDDDAECIHGLGPIAACTVCNGRDERTATQLMSELTLRIFPAKYAGHCNACNLPITVGQFIAWHPETGPPIHDACRQQAKGELRRD